MSWHLLIALAALAANAEPIERTEYGFRIPIDVCLDLDAKRIKAACKWEIRWLAEDVDGVGSFGDLQVRIEGHSSRGPTAAHDLERGSLATQLIRDYLRRSFGDSDIELITVSYGRERAVRGETRDEVQIHVPIPVERPMPVIVPANHSELIRGRNVAQAAGRTTVVEILDEMLAGHRNRPIGLGKVEPDPYVLDQKVRLAIGKHLRPKLESATRIQCGFKQNPQEPGLVGGVVFDEIDLVKRTATIAVDSERRVPVRWVGEGLYFDLTSALGIGGVYINAWPSKRQSTNFDAIYTWSAFGAGEPRPENWFLSGACRVTRPPNRSSGRSEG